MKKLLALLLLSPFVAGEEEVGYKDSLCVKWEGAGGETLFSV